MGSSLEEVMTARDLTVFLLENLGFTINQKKSVLIPAKAMMFLGMIVDSSSMTVFLPEEKVVRLMDLCNKSVTLQSMTALELSRLIGKLLATRLAISPALVQLRKLQICLRQSLQNQSLQKLPSYGTKLHLSQGAKQKLKWWSRNLSLRQGRPLTILPPDMTIQSDAASSGGWGGTAKG